MSALPVPAGSQSSLEADLLARINGGRSPDLLRHSGLAAVARSRAQSNAARGQLNHSGASSAIANAAPDPAESNGAPDDGYTGTWCENLALASDGTNIGAQIYSDWLNSPSHKACMNNTQMNSAGVGVHHDPDPCPGASKPGCWWAVLDLSRDRTPPGSAAAVKPSTPKPVATRAPQPQSPSTNADTNNAPAADDDARVAGAVQTPKPSASPTPTPTPTPATATPDIEKIERGDTEVLTEAADEPTTKSSGFGFREYGAITILLAFALFVLFLMRRRI